MEIGRIRKTNNFLYKLSFVISLALALVVFCLVYFVPHDAGAGPQKTEAIRIAGSAVIGIFAGSVTCLVLLIILFLLVSSAASTEEGE